MSSVMSPKTGIMDFDTEKADSTTLLQARLDLTRRLIEINATLRDTYEALASFPEELQSGYSKDFERAYKIARGYGLVLESALKDFTNAPDGE